MQEPDYWNRYESLEGDEEFAGYLLEAMTEGLVGFVDALSDVGVARFINHIADRTGIDRLIPFLIQNCLHAILN